MQTEIIKSEQKQLVLSKSNQCLKDGEVIAFPTETVYGLGAHIFQANAVMKIFEIKGRDFNKPMAAHISNLNQVELLAFDIPDEFYKLAEAFLPGALSIVLKKKPNVPDIVTAGFDTIAIRYPDNKIALELIENFGQPLAATSANISGKNSAKKVDEIVSEFRSIIPLIIDDGPTLYGIESTVISLVDISKPRVFRQGQISLIDIESVLKRKI